MVEPGATFGARLRALRTRRGVSQRWLAREAGLSDAFVCQLESGWAGPSADSLARLADVLGYTMDELWRGVGRLGPDDRGDS